MLSPKPSHEKDNLISLLDISVDLSNKNKVFSSTSSPREKLTWTLIIQSKMTDRKNYANLCAGQGHKRSYSNLKDHGQQDIESNK